MRDSMKHDRDYFAALSDRLRVERDEAVALLRRIVVNCMTLPPSPIAGAVTVDRFDVEIASTFLSRIDGKGGV